MKIEAIDINIPGPEVKSDGIAYYRLTIGMRDFLQKCMEDHTIVGFEWESGDMNFGVILGEKKKPV